MSKMDLETESISCIYSEVLTFLFVPPGGEADLCLGQWCYARGVLICCDPLWFAQTSCGVQQLPAPELTQFSHSVVSGSL